MRTFKTLSELNDYVPVCIICQKSMRLSIDGMLTSVAPNKPRWSSGRETIHLKLELKEGILRSKHKNHNVSIELVTNKIIDGQDMINRLMPSATYVRKICPTCHFKIHTEYRTGAIKKENCFPVLTIQHEELHYTLKGGKDVQITKYYNADKPEAETATIRLESKFLPPVPLDFDKFRDLAQLNKRLDIIKIFH
jgi:hypothetical protein